jgi:hypothetical protein
VDVCAEKPRKMGNMDVTCLKSAINTANHFEMLPNLKDSVDSNSSIEK